MGERRSTRQDTLPSATAFLDQLAPARKAISGGQAHVKVNGPVYTALDAAAAALDALAAALGHAGRFSGRAP